MKKIIGFVSVIVILIAGFLVYSGMSKDNTLLKKDDNVSGSVNKVKLVYAVHWLQKDQTDGIYEKGVLVHNGLKQYIEEYKLLHPNIEIQVKQIPYGEYADTLKVLSDADIAPDMYQIYSPWGVSYVKDGILNEPPQYIKKDVLENYISTNGVTINNKIWGIPTEINTFALLVNKDLFKAAGIVDTNGDVVYPNTWSQLVKDAVKLTKKDSNGFTTQYGIAFLGEDWQVVDPFLSLLYSNGGKYLSPDFSKSLFNSPEGVSALESELQLFKQGATNINGNFFDFAKGKIGMVIAPPWTKSTFAAAYKDKFESSVGVAPFPLLKSQAAAGYSWFMGVMEKSKNKEEAWKFLQWFSSEVQPKTGTTRYGDLLANNIGAIPARTEDFQKHKDVLGDFFSSVYVDQMKNAISEPNVREASSIKAALMKEILLAWSGKKTAKEALSAAEIEVNKILSNK